MPKPKSEYETGQHPNSRANLVLFKKGNPGGPGRGKGKKNFKDAIVSYLEEVDRQNGGDGCAMSALSRRVLMVLADKNATNNEIISAATLILDRVEGRTQAPQQRAEDNPLAALSDSELEDLLDDGEWELEKEHRRNEV